MADQLTLDWYDALLILRRAIDHPEDIRDLITRCEVALANGQSVRLVQLDENAECTTIWMHPVIKDLPKVERVEALLYASAGVWFNLHYPGDVFSGSPREAFRFLCQRAGCWWTNSSTIRERWRMIDYKSPAHLLPLAQFETRHRCTICDQPVATDAGVTLTHDGKLFDPERADPLFNVASLRHRDDVHEECMRYVHRVMIPARLEQIAEEKRRNAAEIDR